jgi:hypothetical protein
MPAGTPPQKVLNAVKNFAREEFGAKHRYAMVLHTDEPHPHVHLVVKALGADGKRLNIRRATLRNWRREFARHLRAQGVAANATPRQVRGQVKPPKADGLWRAALRGASTHQWEREEAVARELAGGQVNSEPGKSRLLETRREVVRGWNAVAESLFIQGRVELALAVRRFAARMPAVKTEKEMLAARLSAPPKEREHRELSS